MVRLRRTQRVHPSGWIIRGGLVFALLLAYAPRGRADDYFTDLEIDQIREAQNIGRRIPVFLKIAEIRLARLGLLESDETIETEDRDGNAITRGLIRVLDPEAARELERARQEIPDFENDLGRYSRGDLLRGFYQALDEAMANIDDAYERGRGDVRPPLEELLAFTESTIPALETFTPQDEDEEIALDDAYEIATIARDGAAEALEVVPKTERR